MNEVVSVPFGLISGRQIHSPLLLATIRPSLSWTSGRKSPFCGWFSPNRYIEVSGASASVATGARMNRRTRVSTTVSAPGLMTKV